MQSDPAIKAALDAAERETTTAGKIAAFLRALPMLVEDHTGSTIDCGDTQELAAAVEAAAKEPST